jgi:hypothetical protein
MEEQETGLSGSGQPQVSVGGLLDRQFWDTILGKILSIEEVQKRCTEEKKKD